MRIILSFLIFLMAVSGAEVHLKHWKQGESFSAYLQRHGIDSTELYRQISPDDMKFISEVYGGEKFYEMTEGKTLLQALVPIGEEMQIHLFKDSKGNYRFDIIPIIYKKVKDRVCVALDRSCSTDIDKSTHNPQLSAYLKKLYKKRLDFKKLRKGDTIAFIYSQKSRLGMPWGEPRIEGALIKKHNEKEYFVYVGKNGETTLWENEKVTAHSKSKKGKGKKRKRLRKIVQPFIMPLRSVRITSRFTYKRWHPILHRWRPHLGTDFGGRRGTPIYAINSGRVVYAGWMRGYGRVVKIAHGNGYVSLYAHQSRIHVHVGQRVKRGEMIGRIGSTGRSTGPHLHLGLYRYGRPVNPLSVIKKKRAIVYLLPKKVMKKVTPKKPVMSRHAKEIRRILRRITVKPPQPFRWERAAKELIEVPERVIEE